MKFLLATVLLAQVYSPWTFARDGDGVVDAVDACPNTLYGAAVDANGCSVSDLVPCEPAGFRWLSRDDYVAALSETIREDDLATDATGPRPPRHARGVGDRRGPQ